MAPLGDSFRTVCHHWENILYIVPCENNKWAPLREIFRTVCPHWEIILDLMKTINGSQWGIFWGLYVPTGKISQAL